MYGGYGPGLYSDGSGESQIVRQAEVSGDGWGRGGEGEGRIDCLLHRLPLPRPQERTRSAFQSVESVVGAFASVSC